MPDSVLSSAERAFLATLDALGVRYLVVGMSAALLEGANGSTQDIDLWFESLTDPRIAEAARGAGGVFGMAPPAIGGDDLGDRFDVVTHADGLADFGTEYANARSYRIDGVPVRVLPLERVIASKRASDRPKDRAVLPLLEETLQAKRAIESGPEPDTGSE